MRFLLRELQQGNGCQEHETYNSENSDKADQGRLLPKHIVKDPETAATRRAPVETPVEEEPPAVTGVFRATPKVSFRRNPDLEREGFAIKKKRFAAEQIVAILEQAELGILIAELIRQVRVSEQTFYRWKKKYSGLGVDQVRQLKQLREGNVRPKRIVAELTLDKVMLQDVLSKKF